MSSKRPRRRPTRNSHTDEPSELDQTTDSNVSTSSPEPRSSSPSGDTTLEPADFDHIQILDIHQKNPMISYNSQLFSCSWSSTIGTDLYLTSPLFSTQRPEEELAALSRVSVLGASGLRLVGQAAELVPRRYKRVSRASILGKRFRRESQPAVGMKESSSMGKSLPGMQVDDATFSRLPGPYANQSAFLQRLSDLKISKNETDTVPRYPPRTYTGLGWRYQRQLGDEEIDSDLELQDLHGNIVTKRRRGKVGRPRKRAMEDPRLPDRQTVGDLRQVDITPMRWEELQGDEEPRDAEATASETTEEDDGNVQMGDA
ncbi:MAG: hypothetical protein Q9167_001274 [Letrouitia subvulpina]